MKITSAEFVKSAADPVHYPPSALPEIAFAGKSNVGKSSLINCLVNRKKLALTSSTPGRTRLLNFFLVNGLFSFVDLPGYGFAKVSPETRKEWGPMVERYLRERENLRAVILILDVRRDPSPEDLSLMEWLRHYRRDFIIVLTKSDKLSKSQAKVRLARIRKELGNPPEPVLLFSALSGERKEELWKEIEKRASSKG